MTPYLTDPWAWQESWDRQQEAYLPDREERFAAMIDTVEAVAGPAARILDLAGGTGSISLRALRRMPAAKTVVLDIDPVLLTIARASLDQRSTVSGADLRAPEWTDALSHKDFDAVVTATALHWLEADRLRQVYAEIRGVLRPGGVFINADHIPDDGLPGLSAALMSFARARREARYAAGVVLPWEEWWQHVAKDPALGPLIEDRRRALGERHTTESEGPLSWHVQALRAAGFAEVGVVWRGGTDAAVAALR